MNSTLPILIASFSTWISPQLIAELCRQIGYKFRVRQLDPWTTIHALVVQALHGNTALSALRHQLNLNVTVSALCQARQRLPLALLHRIVAHHASDDFTSRATTLCLARPPMTQVPSGRNAFVTAPSPPPNGASSISIV